MTTQTKTLSETSAEVDRRAKVLAQRLHLRADDAETYMSCVRAVLREDPLLARDYDARGQLNTLEQVEADLARVEEELERLVAEYPRLKPRTRD